MKSTLLLLSSLVATCYSAAVPIPQPDALLAREDQSGQTVTVVVTITSTTTLSSSTKKTTSTKPTGTVVYVTITSTVTKDSTPVPTTTPANSWGGPWNSNHHPPWWSSWLTPGGNPVTMTDTIGLGPVTVYSPVYITITASETDVDDNYAATVTLPALTRSTAIAAREEPGWPWHHSSWRNPHWTSSYDPSDGPEVTTIYVNPSPSTITQYVTVTAVSSTETPRITFYPPRNAEPEAEAEPQIFSLWPSASRTVQESPTPPLPWWYWWSTPTATPIEIDERKVVEKREPQTLDFDASRTVEVEPEQETSTIDWTFWDPPHHPGHKHTSSSPYIIEETATLPFLTLGKKREPQTLNIGSRTVQVGPKTVVHHPSHKPTGTPYIIEQTATLSMITLKKKEPQTLWDPSRTNEITPTGPSYWYPWSTAVSTVYVTITEYPYVATSSPHHHPHSTRSTQTIIYTSNTDDYYTPEITRTGTVIDATLTLPPFVVTPAAVVEKRVAEADPEANPEPQSLSLGLPGDTTSKIYYTTWPGKENPCRNIFFSPPPWCYQPPPTSIVTETITYTGTVIEGTATLPPLVFTDPGWWGRKDKRSRRRAGAEQGLEERQELGDTQTRTFTYSPPTAAPERSG